MLPIPWYLKFILGLALKWGLSYVGAHFGPDVAQKIRDILEYLGLLGNRKHTEQVHERVNKLHACEGVACPPQLKV